MKKILITLLVILFLVAAIFAYAAYNANSLVASFKPEIEAAASKVVGAPVSLGELSIGIFPESKINVNEFSIGGQDGPRFNNLELKIALMPLLSRALEITSLTIKKPSLVIEKDGNRLAVAGLKNLGLDKDKTKAGKGSGEHEKRERTESDITNKSGFKLQLKKLNLEDAAVTLRDTQSKKELLLATVDLNSAIEFADRGINLPTLEVSGDVLSSGKLNVNGSITGFGTKGSELALKGEIAKLAQENLSQISSFFVANLPLTLSGTSSINFTVNGSPDEPKVTAGVDLSASEITKANAFTKIAGDTLKVNLDTVVLKPNISCKGSLELSKLSLLALGSSVENFTTPFSASMQNDILQLDASALKLALTGAAVAGNLNVEKNGNEIRPFKMHIDGFSGKADIEANLNLTSQEFNTKTTAASIRVESFLAAVKPDLAGMIEGSLSNLSVAIKGVLNEKLTQNISGPIEVVLVDGTFKGFNIAGEVLRAVTSLPFISGSLYSKVPASEIEAVSTDKTPIKKFTAHFDASNARLTTNNLKLESKVFDLSAKGSIGFDASLDLDTQLLFNKTFSTALTSSAKELNSLLDQDGRLAIPLVIKGTAPKLVILPQMDALLKIAAQKGVQKKLGQVLDKALGGKKGLGGLLGF